MKSKIIKIILIGIIATPLFYSCDSDFEQINSNQVSPTVVPEGQLLLNAQRNLANTMYTMLFYGEMGAVWGQHWSKNAFNSEELYNVRLSSRNNIWANLYVSTINATIEMERLALDNDNTNLIGVAKVVQAYTYLLLTDTYGGIPMSEAGQGLDGNFTPAYDSQEDVYSQSIALLDEAMDLLANEIGDIDDAQDVIYAGDINKWRKFAASLKFRALMRISGRINVAAQLQEVVNSGLLFSSVDDEAKFSYLEEGAVNVNPIFNTIVTGNRIEYILNESLVNYMDGTNGITDERLVVYGQLNNEGVYKGKPAGYLNIPDEFTGDNVSQLGTRFLDAQLPAYFLSYTELQFLLAEATKKGFISGGDAQAETYYRQGIRSSFLENGLTEADFNTYISQSTVAYNSTNAVDQIALQNWIGLFGQGFETWTEWRRTKVPNLPLAIDAVTTEIPSRIPYPGSEQNVNSANYQNGVQGIEGGDVSTGKFWWLQ
ncbi:SusD/RagB family nutrient-binding outer membrane lipoprotein [Aquimarina sp. 2201CG5-10]|uniref:SusD/RagB family nutrient-binding outer membrane lipoprotein n=1 Tax=Aquimarina callyspongiae TaxID=3098150 RepID=UPI002AB35D83|nr:SusD/RagB family nutrient-binding outer membrane lipoprotein [Aquimarina sp. 2201CG5-10]MDY8134254.1 SusD/RagB family nutrient-binding outer membrane lipoprotein [Aquimarina sp. 2201CG5-10]